MGTEVTVSHKAISSFESPDSSQPNTMAIDDIESDLFSINCASSVLKTVSCFTQRLFADVAMVKSNALIASLSDPNT